MIDVTTIAQWLAIQYKDTNIQTLLTNIGKVGQVNLADVLNAILPQLDIYTATGVWLDFIGYKLGVPARPATLTDPDGPFFGFDDGGVGFDQAPFKPESEDSTPINDDSFRPFLLARAQQLITSCTLKNVRDILLLVFEDVAVIDNYNMTMSVIIYTEKSAALVQALLDSGVVPKPAGVRLYVQVIFNGGETFGFNGNGVGFDQQPFVYQYIA